MRFNVRCVIHVFWRKFKCQNGREAKNASKKETRHDKPQEVEGAWRQTWPEKHDQRIFFSVVGERRQREEQEDEVQMTITA